ncbi:MAG: hypothetical protein K1X55_02330 [Chitinophagales bacterium]|nr:hypothetical protein [Chitinophagales bacterium]
MNNKIIWLVFLVLSLSSFSCKTTREAKKAEKMSKERLKANDESQNYVGTWNWYRTDCCGRMKGTQLAKDVEDTKTYKIYNDGTYDLIVNGKTTTTGKYALGTGTPYKGRESIQFDNQQGALMTISNDTMILSWEYMDLQVEFYTKGK